MATKHRRPWVLILLTLLVIAVNNLAQAPGGGQVQGVIQSNKVPLPGVVVVAANTQTLTAVTTSTDVNGTYTLKLPAGNYRISAQFAAFAPASKDVEVANAPVPVRVDL